ncbi:MAG: hypothetical protein HY403_05700 [Elusimicrobia bacterium]|nr:hypothetical protein [Elusimicrobiota bacterium]
MAKRKHGRKAVRKKFPVLVDLLRKNPERVMGVLRRHGVYFDAGTCVTLVATLDKVAAYHAVPDKRKFFADLLGRRVSAGSP